MIQSARLWLIPILGLSAALSFCVSPLHASELPEAREKMKSLMVYGEGFMFSVREPDGWYSDTREGARKYGANIIFFKLPGPDRVVKGPIIRAGVIRKVNDDLGLDLELDMNRYHKRNPQMKFEDFQATHPKYRVHAKVYVQEHDSYEYVIMVDPGPGIRSGLSLALTTYKEPAAPDVLDALRSITASLGWLGSPKIIDKTRSH